MTPTAIIQQNHERFEHERREALYRFKREFLYQLHFGWQEPSLDDILSLSSARIQSIVDMI